MKQTTIITAMVFLSFSASVIAQTYVSPQQKTTTNGFTDRVETELIKKVIIDGENFSAQLPEGGEISGTLKHWKTIEGVTAQKSVIYQIDGGGLLSIVDDLEDNNWDCIVLNLLGTPKKKFYTFWLTKGNKGDD